METKPKLLGYFEVEAISTLPPEKIYNFFQSNSIKLVQFELKEKKEQQTTYTAAYEFSVDTMSDLYVLMVENSLKQNDFKITQIIENEDYKEAVIKYMDLEKQNNEKFIEEYEKPIEADYIKGYNTPGLEYINHVVIQKQRELLSQMVKKMGMKFLKGNFAMNIPHPIHFFEMRTNLEAFVSPMKIIDQILYQATDTSSLERLKILTKYLIASLSMNLTPGTPLNSTLGETFQAQIGDLSAYLETTSITPPIFNFYFKHPLFISYGYVHEYLDMGANSMVVETKGKFYIKFTDGAMFSISVPKVKVAGMTVGSRYINFFGGLLIEDIANELVSVINFNKYKHGSFFRRLFSNQPQVFPDAINGFITYKKHMTYADDEYNSEKVMTLFNGEWSNYLKCNGELFWQRGEFKQIPQMEKMLFTLPSDSRLRHDFIFLKNKEIDYAQQAKIHLDERDRKDQKLRELYNKKE